MITKKNNFPFVGVFRWHNGEITTKPFYSEDAFMQYVERVTIAWATLIDESNGIAVVQICDIE